MKPETKPTWFDTYADINAWVMAGKENNGEQLDRKLSVVHAVNSHEELLDQLKVAVSWLLGSGWDIKKMKEVIAKAKGL